MVGKIPFRETCTNLGLTEKEEWIILTNMQFWDLWRSKETRVKLKDLNLTYYEVNQILNRIDQEYSKLFSSGNHEEKKVGRIGLLVLKKTRNNFKEFIKKKYNYTE